jgi:hypothetical protein
MRKLLITVAVLMSLITLLGLSENLGTMIFAGGSDALMSLAAPGLFLRMIFLLVFVAAVLTYNHFEDKNAAYIILVLFFSFWVLSGRMVATFPDGRLITGWFYIPVKTVDLCKDDADCDKPGYARYTKQWLWMYNVKNRETDVMIFAGPFLDRKLERLLDQKFFGLDSRP